jgi:hypothetical protein
VCLDTPRTSRKANQSLVRIRAGFDLLIVILRAVAVQVDVPNADKTLISFTTGPRGVETHWRQVVFLLREPFAVSSGESLQVYWNAARGPLG